MLQKYGSLLASCFGLVSNCGRWSDGRCHLQNIGLEDVIASFFDTATDENMALFCYVSVAYLLSSKTVQNISLNLNAVKKLVNLLKGATSDKALSCNWNFLDLGGDSVVTGAKVLVAIESLANNSAAKRTMVASNVFEYLLKYGNICVDVCDLELTLNALTSLLDNETALSAMKIIELKKFLETLIRERSDEILLAANRVYSKLGKCSNAFIT